MLVVAEGIETPEARRGVTAMGCNCGQGYLFSRPLPPEDAHRFLLEHGSPTPAHSGAIAVAEAFGSPIG
jgi:EAL domain-containing protein (putative c-di-GMP-specific phosphodiesterase class I)